MADRYDVLIVGAGPTGMVLAMRLVQQGITNIKILDKAPGVAQTSRAAGVQARTLELYRQLGLADQVVQKGHATPLINYWIHGKIAAAASLSDSGADITPYNFLLCIPQNVHEQILEARCKELGIHVEHNATFNAFADHGDHISGTYTGGDGVDKTVEARYVVGADGAHSVIRHTLKTNFAGAAYRSVFFLADVEATGRAFNGEAHIALDGNDFLSVFPFDSGKRGRIIGVVDESMYDKLTFEDVRPRISKSMGIAVDKVIWFSTYRVHHRMAAQFRTGRAFLIGDAAHIHSPAGGQGMNTGIGDAANLAWKLAYAIRGQGGEQLLESFGTEREGFARTLLKTTDQVFTFCTDSGLWPYFVRVWIAPVALHALSYYKSLTQSWFKGLSQTAVSYRGSRISQGRAGHVFGGDRLPWVRTRSYDNVDAQRGIEFAVHVYGAATPAMRDYCAWTGMPLHEFAWSSEAAAAGLAQDAAYLVRPDLYVACADPRGDPETLKGYFLSRGIQIRPR